MTRRQKHKSKKRPRSWHRRGNGSDDKFRRAMKRISKAEKKGSKQ